MISSDMGDQDVATAVGEPLARLCDRQHFEYEMNKTEFVQDDRLSVFCHSGK